MGAREVITIPYVPRQWFLPLHDTHARWVVIVAHRRCGKTTATLNHLQRDALRVKESRYAYIAPTYKQAKNIAWDILKQYSRVIPNIQYNEQELTAKYPNGSKITLYGADNPDSLRGIGLWGVVFDEYSQQPSNIFSEIIRPALADHSGYAIWIGTPKGKNEFFRLYQKGKKEVGWLSLLLTIKDTHALPQLEIDDARRTMTEEEFDQEFMCSFEAAIKGSYYGEDIRRALSEKRISSVRYDSFVKVHTIWDLGIGDAMAIGFFQKVNTELRMIDYVESSDRGLNYYVSLLLQKKYRYGKHFAPHDIQVRELSTGKSRLEIAQQLGIRFEITPNLPVEDGINATRLMFPRLWIDEKLTYFIDAISQYRKEWDDKRGMFKNAPLHDWTSHAADMLRYAAIVENKMSNETLSRDQLSSDEVASITNVY